MNTILCTRRAQGGQTENRRKAYKTAGGTNTEELKLSDLETRANVRASLHVICKMKKSTYLTDYDIKRDKIELFDRVQWLLISINLSRFNYSLVLTENLNFQ